VDQGILLALTQVGMALNPPRFRGSILTATALGTGSNINYTTVSEDNYGGWNSGSHYWAAPQAGLYFAAVQFKWGSSAPAGPPSIAVFGGATGLTGLLRSPNAPSISTFCGLALSGFFRCAAGDQVNVQLLGAGFTTQSDTPQDNNYIHLWRVSQ
jgi:hypothetical protein